MIYLTWCCGAFNRHAGLRKKKMSQWYIFAFLYNFNIFSKADPKRMILALTDVVGLIADHDLCFSEGDLRRDKDYHSTIIMSYRDKT